MTLKSLLRESETDDIKKILKQDYETFVAKLGDNINDPKFVFALKSLSTQYPIKTVDMSPAVRNLRPTQNEVVLDKSLSYGLKDAKSADMYLRGGVVAVAGKSIVTAGRGKYVIDGHHRWSQLFCMNPAARIKSLDIVNISDPMKALKATQIGVAGELGWVPYAKGGGVNLFTITENTLKQYVIDTITDDVVDVFRKYKRGSTKEEISSYIWQNVELLKSDARPVRNAPSRELMPQTDDAPQFKNSAVNVSKVKETKDSNTSLIKRMKMLAGL